MALADLVEAIRAELQLDTEIEFVVGAPSLEGPLTRRDRGYVRVEGFARAENAVWEHVDVRALLLTQYVEPRSDEEPVDPDELYRLGALMRDSLANRRRLIDAAGQVWLLSLIGVGFDHEVQGAEAIIQCGRENPFETVAVTP